MNPFNQMQAMGQRSTPPLPLNQVRDHTLNMSNRKFVYTDFLGLEHKPVKCLTRLGLVKPVTKSFLLFLIS